MTTEEKVQQELNQKLNQLQENLKIAKSIAVAEAWKILQLLVAQVIQDIEIIAKSWTGPEKKELAMNLISGAYDKLFLVVDVPMIPSFLEIYLHQYIKKILLLLVSSSIDAMVATFRQIGFFVSNNQYVGINKI